MRLSHDGRSGSSSGSNVENARRCTGWGASRGGTPTCLSCGSSACDRRLECRSRMRREFHVRFCEGGGVRAPSATRHFFGWGDPGADYDVKVLGQANQALALDPNNSNAYDAKADYLALSHRPSEAVGVTDAGLAVNPNDVTLYTPRTTAENALGHYEQAKADAERAIRLSPRDFDVGIWHVVIGDAEINLGHFDAAIAEYRKALDLGWQQAFFVHTNLAAAYAQSGKMEESKAEMAEARRLNPLI